MASPITLSVHIEEWAAKTEFRIARLSRRAFKAVVVELSDGTHLGRGEGLPVHYMQETAESLYDQIQRCAPDIECGIDRERLQKLMPPGGARKAVDSALWDLEAKCSGRTIWELTGIRPKAVTTVLTIGIEDTADAMAARALEAAEYPILKIKVDENQPVACVAAVRAARPDAGLVVDANQAWTFEQLVEIAPRLAELGVTLIEQPLRRGFDQQLEGYTCPVPLSADESCQHRGELEEVAARYQIINIKLEKAGGLTEGLHLAEAVRSKGLELLVSNMGGTSLSMAPAFVLAQMCKYVELDGHLILKHDRFPRLECQRGEIKMLDPQLWG